MYKYVIGYRDEINFSSYYDSIFSKKIYREIKDSIFIEENDIWCLALDINDNLVGFCSSFQVRDKMELTNFYVFGKHRGNGIFKKMFDLIWDRNKSDLCFLVTKNKIVEKYCKEKGFENTDKRGNWKRYEL